MLLCRLVQKMRLDQKDSSVLIAVGEVDDLPSNAIVALWVVGVVLAKIFLNIQCCRCKNLLCTHPSYPLLQPDPVISRRVRTKRSLLSASNVGLEARDVVFEVQLPMRLVARQCCLEICYCGPD